MTHCDRCGLDYSGSYEDHRLGTSDTLDAAWAAAEAELPDGWAIRQLLEIRQLFLAPKRQWRAEAGNDALYYRRAYGATPAAALLALAGVLQADR